MEHGKHGGYDGVTKGDWLLGTGLWALGSGNSLWLPVGRAQRLIYYAAGLPEPFVLRGHKIITRPTAKFILPALEEKI